MWALVRPVGAGLVVMALVTTAVELGLSSAASAASSSASAPACPPECGRVAAGDPLLVPYITSNPGPGWLALPDTSVQGYVDTLRQDLHREARTTLSNVAGARWAWSGGKYEMTMVLVSSPSLTRLGLSSPTVDAQDVCSASRGFPVAALSSLVDVPTSVYGLCVFSGQTTTRGASIVAFDKADVVVLMEITTSATGPLPEQYVEAAARTQYLTLPSGGVLVSTNGFDLPLAIVWGCIVLAAVGVLVAWARRRQGVAAAGRAIAELWKRRRLAVGVAAVAVVGAMAFAMLDASVLHGVGGWFNAEFGDMWTTWSSAADMTFSGGYAHIYSLDRALELAPTFLVLLAPVARIAFHLSFPYPGAVLYPQAFLVSGPLFLSAVALPICGADRWLQYLQVTDLRRRLAVLGTLAVTLPPVALYGHPEDLLALGAMLYGLLAALEGRHRAAGWWLGVALAFQFLAFLAVPLALVLLKRRQWPATIVPMIVVPLSVVLVPLVADPSVVVSQLVHQKVYDDFGFISPTWQLDRGVGAFVRGAVAVLSIPAALVVSRVLPADRRSAANLVLWVLAVLFTLRVLEPELVPYFLAPPLALLPLSACRAPWWRLGAACAGAVWLNWWLHDPVEARWLEWAFLAGQLAVLGMLAIPARASKPQPQRSARAAPPIRSQRGPQRRPRPAVSTR